MKRYDFDRKTDRRMTGSYKWDSSGDPDVIPLWVADMDFMTAPCIIEALRRRVDHGVFGYTLVGDDYYNAVIDWFDQRHGLSIERDWIIYTSGVVPAISATIKALTHPGDGVIIQTPVYNCFFSSIRNNGCIAVENRLVYRNRSYSIDFADLEQKCKDPRNRVMLLCNPHNPTGRVWRRDELKKIGDICMRHGVTVISDEIHCELVFPGQKYTPYASLGKKYLEHSVTFTSPSKAFNIAGLQIANIFIADSDMRQRIDRAINDNEVCDVNPFGVTALIAAYREGLPWLNELLIYLAENYCMLCDFFASHFPMLKVTKLEGTYLAWVNIEPTGMKSDKLEHYLLTSEKVWVNAGDMYGAAGENFIRINLACPRSTLMEGLERLGRGLSSLLDN